MKTRVAQVIYKRLNQGLIKDLGEITKQSEANVVIVELHDKLTYICRRVKMHLRSDPYFKER
jgi:hypothetical protein